MNKYYLLFPNFNPVACYIGNFSIHWYGVMYIISLFFAIQFSQSLALKNKNYWIYKNIYNILYIVFIGVLLGGRLGYIVFYNYYFYMNNILECFKIWKGGMSFHGGLIGGSITIYYFIKKNKKKFFEISDFIIPIIPFGLGAGRIGNLINGELIGRINVNSPIYMFFPSSKKIDIETLKTHPELQHIFDTWGLLPRHPSQLYEFFFEGIILFIIFNHIKHKKNKNGYMSALFLIYYSIIRIFLEFFREPDIQLGFFYNFFTLGQILSIPMLVIGIIIFINIKKSNK
ncbi:MAG: prolipoprotein diacylglyceryl transferase [Buchnera aphidicola (Eriosoma harunire)]